MSAAEPDTKTALAAVSLCSHIYHGDILGIREIYTDGADPRLVATAIGGMFLGLLHAHEPDVEGFLAEAAAHVAQWGTQ